MEIYNKIVIFIVCVNYVMSIPLTENSPLYNVKSEGPKHRAANAYIADSVNSTDSSDKKVTKTHDLYRLFILNNSERDIVIISNSPFNLSRTKLKYSSVYHKLFHVDKYRQNEIYMTKTEILICDSLTVPLLLMFFKIFALILLDCILGGIARIQ